MPSRSAPALPQRPLNAGWASRLLDSTVVFSFDRTGYARHARRFSPEDDIADLRGRQCLITGANSGIGRATATALAQRGADVWLLCRHEGRGLEARDAIRAAAPDARVELQRVDVASLGSIDAACDALLAALPGARVDVLVHNAGVLPATRQLSSSGHELTWATHVVGPQRLTARLLPALRCSEDARIIWVSSGGMYTQRLNVGDLDWDLRRYDGVVAYAQSKRAQVVLSEQWAERLQDAGITSNAMHPGWADTPAVRSALPRFHALTSTILRSPSEGADTVVWLAGCPRLRGHSGALWFDRQARRSHLLPWTRERPETRAQLWQQACADAGVDSESACVIPSQRAGQA